MKPDRLAFALLAALAPAALPAADGDLDTSFGTGGSRRIAFDIGGTRADAAAAIRVDEAGRLVVAGTASDGAGDERAALARLTPGGALDTQFGPDANGRTTGRYAESSPSRARSLEIGAFGPCAIGYADAAPNVPTASGFAYCTTVEGAVQSQFSTGALEPIEINASAPAASNSASDRIPVAGSVGAGTAADFWVAVLFRQDTPPVDNIGVSVPFGDAMGRRVVAFDIGGQPRSDVATAIVRIPGGGYWVVGRAQFDGTDDDFAIAKLTEAGALDNGFSTDGKLTIGFDLPGSNQRDRAVAAALDPEGRLVVAGTASRDASGNDLDVALLRLLPGGSVDTGFGPNGKRALSFDAANPARRDEVGGIAIDAQSRIYVAGTTFSGLIGNPSDIAVMRVGSGGEPDVFFGTQGRVSFDYLRQDGTSGADRGVGLLLDAENRVVVLGQRQHTLSDTDFTVLRLANSVDEPPLHADSFEDPEI